MSAPAAAQREPGGRARTTLPRLHVVTDDAVLARPAFLEGARALLGALGPVLALHVRGPKAAGRALFERAAALREPARAAGALLLVNDRVDVAGAAGADGVHLGRRSLALPVARALLGSEALLGYSAHAASEARDAARAGADFVVLGSVWATPSHPGRPGAGPALLADAAGAEAPLLAIGGVTPERVREALDAGAWGVAVLSGVWDAAAPLEAAAAYAEALAGTEAERA